MKKLLSFTILPQLALAALGLVSICRDAHAQAYATDKSLAFVLDMDFLSPEVEAMAPGGAGRGFTERDFTFYRFDEDGSGFYFVADKYGSTGNLRFSVSASTRAGDAQSMWLHQSAQRDSASRDVFAECLLQVKNKQLPRQVAADDTTPSLGLISYAGICNGRPVEFTLAVSRAPSKAIENECIDQGVELTSKLKSCEAAVADNKKTIAVTQSELSKTRSERDQARTQLQKLSSTMSTSVIPYLKRVVDTLKDPNNFYRRLRSDANGVLDASSK